MGAQSVQDTSQLKSTCIIDYDASRYSPAYITGLFHAYQALLSGIAHDPQQPWHAYSL